MFKLYLKQQTFAGRNYITALINKPFSHDIEYQSLDKLNDCDLSRFQSYNFDQSSTKTSFNIIEDFPNLIKDLEVKNIIAVLNNTDFSINEVINISFNFNHNAKNIFIVEPKGHFLEICRLEAHQVKDQTFAEYIKNITRVLLNDDEVFSIIQEKSEGKEEMRFFVETKLFDSTIQNNEQVTYINHIMTNKSCTYNSTVSLLSDSIKLNGIIALPDNQNITKDTPTYDDVINYIGTVADFDYLIGA